MSQTQARSSQMPKSRSPPQGSSGSAYQQQGSRRRSSSNSQDDNDGYIPSDAITSNTSRPNRTSYRETDQRRKSQVTFTQAPAVDPDDSISQMNARSTKPGPNRNSDRRASRQSWNQYSSQVTRNSSQNGVAWSGSGAALTENNLEKFNEETGKAGSTGYTNQEPPSDQQEVPRGSQAKSRRYTNATNGGGAQTNGTGRRGSQQTAQRSSRRYSRATQNVYSQAQSRRGTGTQIQAPSGNSGSGRGDGGDNAVEEVAAGAAAGEAGEAIYSSQSQSKQRSVAVSKNVVDANDTQSGANQTSGGSKAQSKAVSQSRSRRDSKLEEEGEAVEAANEDASQSQAGRKSQAVSRLPYRPSAPSTSPTSPRSPEVPFRGYQKVTKIITKRWPDGTETREREVRTIQPVGAA